MMRVLLAVSFGLLVTQTRAAVLYELDPEIRAKTEQLMREKNRNYRAEAAKRLKGKGHYDVARLEVSGLLSNDDTYRFNKDDFDDQLKPSHSADQNKDIWNAIKARTGLNYRRDMKEMKVAMRGEMNARSKQIIARLKDLEINEIVAHSWGSEFIYAAILNGDIRPPKKLIVAGVPDDDRAKWDMLAARTGTEVYWARADNDAAAIDKGIKVAKEATRDVDFKAKWDARCGNDKKHETCHAHGRKSKPVTPVHVGRFAGVLAHDRDLYYDVLKRQNVISGSVQQLRALETAKIEAVAKQIEMDALASAHREARVFVELSRAQTEAVRREEYRRREPPTPAIIIAKPVPPVQQVVTPKANQTPFSRVLPDLRSYAVNACLAPDQIQSDYILAYDFSYREYDDNLIRELKNGLSDCARRLLDYLVAAKRSANYDALKREAIQERVRAFTPAPPAGNRGGGGYAPPRREEPGCEYDPNIGGTACPR